MGLAGKIYRRGAKEMVLISIYPIVYNLLCLIIVVNRSVSVVNNRHGKPPNYRLWLAHAIADSMRVLFPPVAFLLHPKSWKSMFSERKVESSSKNKLSATPEDNDVDNGTTRYGTVPVQNDRSKVYT